MNNQDRNEIVNHLQRTGFNRLESEVYLLLCRRSSLTGYKISQILNEGSSNIYKALDSLTRKGAVMQEQTPGTKRFSAVSPAEYLNKTEREFKETCIFLQKNIPEQPKKQREVSVYSLESVSQVFERARVMISEATAQIVLDVFPGPLEKLLPFIEKKTEAGINVVVNAYSDISIPYCVVTKKNKAEEALKSLKNDWINIVVDGDKFLLAVVDKNLENVRHAIWTNSPYLAYVLHSGIGSEILFSELIRVVKKHDLDYEIKGLREKYEVLMSTNLPGFRKISSNGK
ncbi:MAG: helix-turn-helix domain-containing protein [bacterium]